MKKVFLIHGFEGTPSGNWRPWLMGELEKEGVYACALAMPSPYDPVCSEWVEEIQRHADSDEVYLVGHSLGVPAILRYLETAAKGVKGVVLVSGPARKNQNSKLDSFLEKPFDFPAIKGKAGKVTIIHGDDDPLVPLADAHLLHEALGGELIVVPGGKHLNGSAGWWTLPQCLEALQKQFTS